MQEAAVSPLTPWADFYLILGGGAAALTGLVFVVITLVADTRGRSTSQATEASIGAFTTPTIVHFSVVLLVSAILTAPWHTLSNPGLLLGLAGLGGIAYAIIALRRVRRQPGYQPVMEDWVWYGVVPIVAYIALVVAALTLPGSPAPALFGIGAVVLLLLFLGIHNAWDVVTYVALLRLQPPDARQNGRRQARMRPAASIGREPDEKM
jgi:hypothetical protein